MAFLGQSFGSIGGNTGGIYSKQTQAAPNPYTVDAGINYILKGGIDAQAQANAYGAQLPGLIDSLGMAPVMDAYSLQRYDEQKAENARIMNLAKINSNNSLASQIGGFRSELIGGKNGNRLPGGTNMGGAYEASITAGEMARNQSSLNETSVNLSKQLMELRDGLMTNIYARQATKVNALMAAQGQTSQQATANIGTVINKQQFDASMAFNYQQLASQEKMAKEQAKATKDAAKSAGFFSMLGSFAGMAGSKML